MIRRALEYVRGMMAAFVAANLMMAAGSLCAVLIPSVVGSVLDNPAAYLTAGACLLLLMAGSALAGYGRTRLLAHLGTRIAVRLRMALMEKLMRVPQRFFVEHSSGELLSVAGNDVNLFRDALSGGLTYVLDTLLSLTMVLVIMTRLDAVLTLVLLASVGLIFCANLLLTRGVTGVSARAQEHLARLSELASQGILGNQEIRACRIEPIALSLLRGANGDWARSTVRLEGIRARAGLIIGLLNAMQLIVLITLGIQRVQAGLLTAGELTSFVLYAQTASGPLSSASSLVVDVRRSLAAMRRLFAILDEPESVPGRERLPQPVRGEIRLSGVGFAYPAGREEDAREVLRGVSLTIPAGSTAALVGESGSGKTTLMKLIAGFLPAQEGDVLIDGHSVGQIDTDSLYEAVAVVSQHPFIFQRSVRDNIACGRPDAADDEVIQAAKMACAHEFIMELPDGYQTVLGENGANLSGGQRQRIAIARAFLKNAPVLLLDEATSALDNRAEADIQAALDRLMKTRTTLIIAHRLSTVRRADCIYYLQDGRILSSGPHERLMEVCPEYRALYELSHPAILPDGEGAALLS